MVLFNLDSTKRTYERLPPIHGFHKLRDQGQDLQNQKETYPEQKERQEDQVVISIKDKMEKTLRGNATTSWDELCIYRVPYHMKEKDNKSYVPQTVSLGPYHHGQTHLHPMEHHKWRAVKMVLERTKHHIGMYIYAMKELEERARACYQAPIDMNSNDFIEMLVLDGCFVLELFRGGVYGFPKIGYARNDPVFAQGRLMLSIQRDMVMLENQLPLFVLDPLLELQLGTPNRAGLVAELAVKFFKPVISWQGEFVDNDTLHVLHCLDVFHRSFFRTLQYSETQNQSSETQNHETMGKQQQQLIHCVTELRKVGVKFKPRKETNHVLWDIEFKDGYLEIPKLLIHDGTKSLFSNLIAFEQCRTHSSDNITPYIIFMDNLINSADDVSHLHHCGIIEHWLGSDSDVADMFNLLCKEVVFDPTDSYLSQLSGELNHYYNRRWNTLKATLRHRYFNTPWAYISFFAAVTLLILTFSQTFYAIYAFYEPPS